MGYLDRIKSLRKKKGWSQTDLGELVGVQQATVQRWEKGEREPSFEQLFKLAEVLDTDVTSLLDPHAAVAIGPRLFIKGEVAGGVWRDAVETTPDEWEAFTGRADVTAKPENRFGLRVVGDSMDLVYPHGTIVECVSVFDNAELVPGKRVVVLRRREDLEYEATVKELVLQGDELWAVPRSSNPSHSPFKIAEQEDGIISVRVCAVVVASIRPE